MKYKKIIDKKYNSTRKKKLTLDEFILLNYDKLSNQEMANIWECDKKTISTHRKHLGIPPSESVSDRLRKNTDYICSQYGKKTSKALAEELSCSKDFIKKIFRENNLKNEHKQIYSLNEHYFNKINTETKSYLLGFIASDGCVYRRNNHQGMLSISVKDIDIEILELFRKELDTTKPIQKITQSEKTTMVTLQLTSDILCDDLLKIGIGIRKTFDMNFKKIFRHINNKYIPYFFLGYFDGDGSITIPKDNTISRSHVRISCPETTGIDFCNKLKKFKIQSCFSIDKHRNYSKTFREVSFINTINKYLFLKFIYINKSLGLTRKRDKSLQFINRVESNATNRKENKDAVKRYESVVLKWEELLGS